MKDRLYENMPKTLKTGSGRWLQISLNLGEGYRVFDPMGEIENGRILFDQDDNWVYDGELLSIAEQEKVAGTITGHQKEREALFKTMQKEPLNSSF